MTARDDLLRVLLRVLPGEAAEKLLAARDEERIREAADWLHSRGLRPAAYLLSTCDIPAEPGEQDAQAEEPVDVRGVRVGAAPNGYRVRWTANGRKRVKTFPTANHAHDFARSLKVSAWGGWRR